MGDTTLASNPTKYKQKQRRWTGTKGHRKQKEKKKKPADIDLNQRDEKPPFLVEFAACSQTNNVSEHQKHKKSITLLPLRLLRHKAQLLFVHIKAQKKYKTSTRLFISSQKSAGRHLSPGCRTVSYATVHGCLNAAACTSWCKPHYHPTHPVYTSDFNLSPSPGLYLSPEVDQRLHGYSGHPPSPVEARICTARTFHQLTQPAPPTRSQSRRLVMSQTRTHHVDNQNTITLLRCSSRSLATDASKWWQTGGDDQAKVPGHHPQRNGQEVTSKGPVTSDDWRNCIFCYLAGRTRSTTKLP